ncbi:hypothetical protein DNHGIG_11740 [Collibacillus ludicampi]|uniref:Uncharacterized protein n=1 Tax=Collibacillus ludicampi TaxID=2771369 RepID=A0AAV4LCR9_9BACL|nr:hypothetical protein DNHGIG_11740 [Collibacillus ludicampi]
MRKCCTIEFAENKKEKILRKIGWPPASGIFSDASDRRRKRVTATSVLIFGIRFYKRLN